MNTPNDIETAIIQELLAEHRWNREALKVKFGHLDQQAYDDAFASLVVAGVAHADRHDVQASRQLRHLAALGVLELDPAPPNGTPDKATLDRVLAREALTQYARRREVDCDPHMLTEELPALVDRAREAGLDAATVSRLAEGREA